MKVARLVVPLAVLILGFALTSAAQATTPSKSTTTKKTTAATKPALHRMSGMVTSVSDSDLVLEHEWKGKKEETKFALDSNTKKEGDITKGCHATVTYAMKNKEREATDVKVSAMKAPAKPAKSAKKPS